MFKRKQPTSRVDMDAPLVVGPKATSLNELREMARDIRDVNWQTPVEKGLAESVVTLVDHLEALLQQRQ